MVAAMAPGIPAILMPTKVAELMMMGPGERHGRVAAAEGKRAEIQCGSEQLPQDFFLAFRAASPYEEYSAFRAVCKMTFCKK